MKDLLAVRNHPTTWGAKPYESQVFKEDALIVRKLRKTGAILIGKLSMVELAGGGGYRYANASLTGPGPKSMGPFTVERRIVQRAGRGDGGGPGDICDRV